MTKRYVLAMDGDYYTNQYAYLTAGSQGLKVIGCEITSNNSGGDSLTIALVNTLVGTPTALPLQPLDERDSAPLSTAWTNVTSATFIATVGRWQFATPTSGILEICRRHPITVAPGSSLQFQAGAAFGTPVNIYFEE